MTLPWGQIAMSDVNAELGRPWNQQIHMADGDVRRLAGQYGQIDMNALRGKSNVSFTLAPGSYTIQEYGQAATSITCNRPVVWTYPGTLASVSVASGGTSSSIFITTNVRRNGTQQTTIRSQTNLTGTIDGKAYTWSINQTALASNADPDL